MRRVRSRLEGREDRARPGACGGLAVRADRGCRLAVLLERVTGDEPGRPIGATADGQDEGVDQPRGLDRRLLAIGARPAALVGRAEHGGPGHDGVDGTVADARSTVHVDLDDVGIRDDEVEVIGVRVL